MTRYAIKPLDSQIDHRPSLIPRIPSILNVVSPIGMGKSTLLILLITETCFSRANSTEFSFFHRLFSWMINGIVSWLSKAFWKSTQMNRQKRRSIWFLLNVKDSVIQAKSGRLMSILNMTKRFWRISLKAKKNSKWCTGKKIFPSPSSHPS